MNSYIVTYCSKCDKDVYTKYKYRILYILSIVTCGLYKQCLYCENCNEFLLKYTNHYVNSMSDIESLR